MRWMLALVLAGLLVGGAVYGHDVVHHQGYEAGYSAGVNSAIDRINAAEAQALDEAPAWMQKFAESFYRHNADDAQYILEHLGPNFANGVTIEIIQETLTEAMDPYIGYGYVGSYNTGDYQSYIFAFKTLDHETLWFFHTADEIVYGIE